MNRFLVVGWLILLSATLAQAQGLTAEKLKLIKAGTVFVRVAVPGASSTGSGFLVKVDGKTGYIVTNNHVVDLSELDESPDMTLASKTKVDVVFESGTPQERVVKAEIVAADPERDLATLKIVNVDRLPTPLDVATAPKLMETMKVFVCGFPFGQQLAVQGKNPEISIGEASVSAIRTDGAGQVASVQLNGALNPGNSGGPVVDSEGLLVGVAVKTVRNAGIGIAIPQLEVARMLNGRPGRLQIVLNGDTPKPNEEQLAKLEIPLIDPLSQIKSLTAHVKVLAPNEMPPVVTTPMIAPGLMPVSMTITGTKAAGALVVPPMTTRGMIVQLELDLPNGKLFTLPELVPVSAERAMPGDPRAGGGPAPPRLSPGGKIRLPGGQILPFPFGKRPEKSDGTDISELNRKPDDAVGQTVRLDAVSPCSVTELGGVFELYVQTDAGNAPANLKIVVPKDLALQIADLGISDLITATTELSFAVRITGTVAKPIGRETRHLVNATLLEFLSDDGKTVLSLTPATNPPSGKPTLSYINRFPEKFLGQSLTVEGYLIGTRYAGRGVGLTIGNENKAAPLNLEVYTTKDLAAQIDSDIPRDELPAPVRMEVKLHAIDPKTGHGQLGVTKIELTRANVKPLSSIGSIEYPPVGVAPKPIAAKTPAAPTPTAEVAAKPVAAANDSTMLYVGIGAAVLVIGGLTVTALALLKKTPTDTAPTRRYGEKKPAPPSDEPRVAKRAKPTNGKPNPPTSDNPFENL